MSDAHNSKIWLDIKKKIEKLIISGSLKVGEKVPSISEVANIFECGKSTSQKILDDLCEEGIIQKQRGVGYFLKPYAREQLISKYKEQWESTILNIANEVNDLQLDSDEIEDIEKALHEAVSSIEK